MTGKFASTGSGMVKYPPEKGDNSMPSDAQNRATAKYKKEHQRQYQVAMIDRTRPKMIAYMDSIKDRQAYIRHLIAVDMKAQGLETDGIDGE